MGIFSLSQDTLKTIQSNQLAATRDQLATQFRQSAGRIKNLQLSLNKPENLQFKTCVCGLNAECVSAMEYSIALYDDSSVPHAPFKSYYDYSGNPCNPTASNCAIEVITKFKAQCMPTLPSADPTAPASCMGTPVEFFAVNFKIQPNSTNGTHSTLFKSVKGSAYTQVSNFAPAGSGVCP